MAPKNTPPNFRIYSTVQPEPPKVKSPSVPVPLAVPIPATPFKHRLQPLLQIRDLFPVLLHTFIISRFLTLLALRFHALNIARLKRPNHPTPQRFVKSNFPDSGFKAPDDPFQGFPRIPFPLLFE